MFEDNLSASVTSGVCSITIIFLMMFNRLAMQPAVRVDKMPVLTDTKQHIIASGKTYDNYSDEEQAVAEHFSDLGYSNFLISMKDSDNVLDDWPSEYKNQTDHLYQVCLDDDDRVFEAITYDDRIVYRLIKGGN